MRTIFSLCRERLLNSLTVGFLGRGVICPTVISTLVCLMILLSGITSAFAEAGDLKWRYKTDEEVLSSPAIGIDGTVYVGSDDSCLYATSPSWEILSSDYFYTCNNNNQR